MIKEKARRLILDTEPAVPMQQLFGYVPIILLATFVVAPRFWEPGGETLRSWAVAQISRQTGEFGNMHAPQLYNLYLQLFLGLDYPFSSQIEHLATSLFCSTSIFLLLCKFLPRLPALLITCAWIPELWVVQTGARVAGIGFLALYLQSNRTSSLTRGYFPIVLLAAVLCENAYVPFLIGHIVGTFITRRYVTNEKLIDFGIKIDWRESLVLMLKASLIILFVLPPFVETRHPSNNIYGFEYPWSPIPSTNSLTVAYLAEGNWRHVMQTVPETEWFMHDWYSTHEHVFGGAQSLFDAAIYNPSILAGTMISNIPQLVRLPLDLIVGFGFPDGIAEDVLLIFFMLLTPIIFYKVFQYHKVNGLYPQLCSIGFGVSTVVATLAPLLFRGRYFIALVPVGLILAAHVGPAIQSALEVFQSSTARKVFRVAHRVDFVRRNILRLSGTTLIVVGMLANEWFLLKLFSRDGILELSSRVAIWSFDIIVIIVGILFVTRSRFFSSISLRSSSGYSNNQTWFTTAITVFVAGCILLSSFKIFGKNSGILNLSENPFLLSGRLASVHNELLATVDKTTRVLALEEPWIKSFTNVPLENSFHALFLPPFVDVSGETEEFLSSLDVIWVSHAWSTEHSSLSTQAYLRYYLHVEPFLVKVLGNGWTMQNVKGFGEIYRKDTPG